MESAKLYYTDGSPFARLCRILIIEWGLPVETIKLDFPLPQSYFDENPMGHVPLLKTVGESIFPTAQIAEQLWAMTVDAETPTFDPLADRQLLTVIMGMGDSLVHATYQGWAGLTQTETNQLGFDPAERNFERVQHTLDWIEAQSGRWLTGDEVNVADYALACILLWTDSRHPIEWRNRPKIADIVQKVGAGDSFAQTVPGPWKLAI